MFQPVYKYFKKIANIDIYNNDITVGKSRGLFDKSIKPFTASNNSLSPVFNYLNTKPTFEAKIRYSGDETRDFYIKKKPPEAGSNCTGWSVILINSVLEKDKSYYPQVFSKVC